MSSIVGPTSPSSGGGGGGGNVVDTLQDTLGAGDRTGTASGILVDDGDLLAMSSGAKITFSSNSNPGGLPDVIVQRSGIRTLAVNQPGGGGATINIGAAGALSFGLNTNDVRLTKDATNRLLVSDGTTQADIRISRLYFGNSPGSTTAELHNSGRTLIVARGDGGSGGTSSPIRINDVGTTSECALQLAGDADTGLTAVANQSVSTVIGGTEKVRVNLSGIDIGAGQLQMGNALDVHDLSIARSGVGLVAFNNPLTSAPASGHFGGLIVGPLSASGTKLVNDNFGGLKLVQADDGIAPVFNVGTNGAISFDGGNNSTDIRLDRDGSLVLGIRNRADSAYAGLNLANSTLYNGSTPKISVNGGSQLLGISSDSVISFKSSSSLAGGSYDLSIVRSGVGELALTNPLTLGPANLTVGNLTVLGTHNISAGGGGSSSTIFATGLIIGNHSPSGSKLISDENGRLIIQDGDSNIASGVMLGVLLQGPGGGGYIRTVSEVFKFHSDNSTHSFASIFAGAYTSNNIGGDSVIILNPNGPAKITVASDGGYAWSSSTSSVAGSSEVLISLSGLDTIAFNKPIYSAPAKLMCKTLINEIASSGSISGDLRIDMQGAKVQTFSVATTGVFTPYNLSYLSSEKQLFVTAVGTVGVSFDSSIKWLGSKPTVLGSGVTYMFSLMNYSPTQVVASYEALSNG